MQQDLLPAKSLFRQNAIDNLNYAGDEIHHSLKIIGASSVALIGAALLAALAIVIWCIWGKLSITVPANGIILPAEQFQAADKLLAESLNDRKEKIAYLDILLKKKNILFKKHYLTLTDLEKAKEDFIVAKEELANVSKNNYISVTRPIFSAELNGHQSLDALVFVSHADGKKVSVGMKVYVLPNALSAYEYGYIHGKVISVSEYPASKESVYPYLGNTSLVDEFFSGGVPFIVKVQLQKDSRTSSGLSWTSQHGPSFDIEPGATVDAKIISQDCSPLQLLTSR